MDHKTFSGLMALVIERAPAIVRLVRRACDRARYLDFLAPLLLRLYLAPVFWMAGTKKFANFSDTADWFGNSEWGLGLPMPYLLVFLVALLETLGALFLLFGFATRLMSLPLMVIMV
ncbi:partial thiosulfate dehydrogenase [quinone] large subunit, partial [Methylococcales bacterium]